MQKKTKMYLSFQGSSVTQEKTTNHGLAFLAIA